MQQLFGGRLIERLHNQAEFLVGGFLSRLFGEEGTEFFKSRAKRASLLAITIATDIGSAK